MHLLCKGFMKEYFCWYAYREPFVPHEIMVERMARSTSSASNMHEVETDNSNPYRIMVMNVVIMNQGYVGQCLIIDEEPNADATRFFDILKDYDEPLWDDCTNHSNLSIVAQMFTIKSDYRLSEAGYDRMVEWVRSILLKGNRLKENFYAAKSIMKLIGLRYQKIDMCPNIYKLYCLENIELTKYRTCRHSRYKPRTGKEKTLAAHKKLRYFPITPRLQRLFMSSKTTEHMTWHQLYDVVDGVMVHPYDGEAWKHFNNVHPSFSNELKNVHLRLCTDRFNQFGLFVASYS